MCYLKELFLKPKTLERSKVKGRKKICPKYTTEKQAGAGMLVSNQTPLRQRTLLKTT